MMNRNELKVRNLEADYLNFRFNAPKIQAWVSKFLKFSEAQTSSLISTLHPFPWLNEIEPPTFKQFIFIASRMKWNIYEKRRSAQKGKLSRAFSIHISHYVF